MELSDNQGIDSRSVLSSLLGKDKIGTEILIQEARGIALRKGNWKYLEHGKKENQKGELYNLTKDIGEKHNLVDEEKERAAEMRKLLYKLINSKKGVRQELKDK